MKPFNTTSVFTHNFDLNFNDQFLYSTFSLNHVSNILQLCIYFIFGSLYKNRYGQMELKQPGSPRPVPRSITGLWVSLWKTRPSNYSSAFIHFFLLLLFAIFCCRCSINCFICLWRRRRLSLSPRQVFNFLAGYLLSEQGGWGHQNNRTGRLVASGFAAYIVTVCKHVVCVFNHNAVIVHHEGLFFSFHLSFVSILLLIFDGFSSSDEAPWAQ